MPRAVRGPPGLGGMRAVQITRFGGPTVMNVVDLLAVPGDGEQLLDTSSSPILITGRRRVGRVLVPEGGAVEPRRW